MAQHQKQQLGAGCAKLCQWEYGKCRGKALCGGGISWNSKHVVMFSAQYSISLRHWAVTIVLILLKLY